MTEEPVKEAIEVVTEEPTEVGTPEGPILPASVGPPDLQISAAPNQPNSPYPAHPTDVMLVVANQCGSLETTRFW